MYLENCTKKWRGGEVDKKTNQGERERLFTLDERNGMLFAPLEG